MNFDWKKMAFASSLAAFSLATSLHAIPPEPCDPEVEPVCCAAPAPGPFAFAYPYDLGINCPRDFYFHIDGLAFQAKQDGMEFAIQAKQDGGLPIAPITYGKVIGFGFSDGSGDWDFNPGARVGMGFYLDHDAWNIDLDWTWVHVTNYKSVHADHNSVLIPLWLFGSSDSVSGLFGSRANAKWNVSYNVFDLSLKKPYYVSRYLILNPFFGARFADIDQHFSVRYSGETPFYEAIHHGEQNEFRGAGARFGVNSDWILGKGWWLFANMSASILAGKFDVHQNMTVNLSHTDTDGFDIHSDYYQNTPNMEFAIGLAWSTSFDCNRYRIGLRAAYEFIEWWDQLNMRKFFSANPGYATDVVSRGNFTMNGFSLRLQFDL